MIKKRILQLLGLGVFGMLLLIFISNYTIAKTTENKTFSNVSTIQKNRVGLLLGTAKYYKEGGINLYFQYRIDAAVALYNNNKIDFILVSGDNRTLNYNEPITFKKELIKRGIPEEIIFLDYAGFRTLDSVVRANAIFGQTEITIISQQFHNERAIYIAEKKGINAIGFNARDVDGANGIKVKLREYFARTKAFLDIIFHVEPKFYGESIEIKRVKKVDTILKVDSLEIKQAENEL
ncbi:SanA/YdcF family protein [Aequorivita marisscotiae]|uniref:ElyC/SanA/YdcF family protein n=1 Tax=Aequorivita marisscotiae TaxID=3040348 RepID=A0ABY8KPJ3_9FLAO|nr:ElyC/SanA/YdcF family protein [Aequorivita sp. Ant34-E75]WGF91381.1 ElyC/SanA/YdcF family protein [Aequorivita sp. Ant34-E75]